MKYIIDAPSNLYKIDGTLRVPVKVGEGDLCWYNTYLKAESYTEPDRKAIEDEVWKFLVFLIDEMDVDDKYNCFNQSSAYRIASTMSYQEAKSKYEAWKKQKDEIHVGDEVLPMDTKYDTMIVTRIWKDYYQSDCIDTMGLDGSICSFLTSQVKKTGRHFNEVEEVLRKMREED